MKQINEMNVIELKAMLFDIDQDIRLKQQQFNSIAQLLREKIQAEQEVKKDGTKTE